jgi:hypothetical protein
MGEFMREQLKKMFDEGNAPKIFIGKVKLVKQELAGRKYRIEDIHDEYHQIHVDHVYMKIGKEIPDIPSMYSRIHLGGIIKFEATAKPYIRADKSTDYNLKMCGQKLINVWQDDQKL